MHADIRKGMLESEVKIFVVENEAEIEKNIDYYINLLPAEAVYTNSYGVDETLPSSSVLVYRL